MDLTSIAPVLETLSEGLIVVDRYGKLLSANKAGEAILGAGCEGLHCIPERDSLPSTKIKQSFKQTISAVRPQNFLEGLPLPLGTYHSDGKAQLREMELPVLRALLGVEIKNLELVVHNKFKPDGVRLNVNAHGVTDAEGKMVYAVCAFTDISAAHVSEQRHNIFRQVFAQTQEAIVITDGSYIVQYANQSYWDLTGNTPEKILNQPFAPLQEDYNEGTSWSEMQAFAKKEGRWSGEFVIRRRSNELLPLWATLHSVVDGNNTITNYVLTLSDLTSLKSSQEELYRLVSKDTLTGLSNRREFFEQLEKLVDRATRNNEKFALLLIDLLRFKSMNDSLGHQAGDRVLQKVAQRLSKSRKGDDAVARLAADEFAIVISACASDIDLAMAIENIRKTVEEPIMVGEHSVSPCVCIGVTVFPEDGADASTLAKNADIALAAADRQGSGMTRFFTKRLFTNITKHFWLENNLRNSFGKKQLLPYFQPQLNLQNNKPEEAEVLIRLNHPENGLINPSEFIEIAEHTGLIAKVTEEIIDASCAYMRQWKTMSMPLSCLALNISATLLLEPDFVSQVCGLIEKHNLSASDILIEITEGSAMADPDQTSLVLKQLKAYGLAIAIDDFGTGYSSLSYLKKFAVDQIKIDQSFVRDLGTSQESRSIVKAIIRMCDTLGFETLAEGIETIEQAKILQEFGCKKLQGYLIAKPLSAVDFFNFMKINGSGMQLIPPITGTRGQA